VGEDPYLLYESGVVSMGQGWILKIRCGVTSSFWNMISEISDLCQKLDSGKILFVLLSGRLTDSVRLGI